MASYRINRINEELCRTLTEILRTVKDPRVSEAFISITGADCSPDLKYVKFYYSVIGADEEKRKTIAAGLKNATGYIRGQLAHIMNLRLTPEPTFIYDTSIEHGARINELLTQIARKPASPDAGGGSDGDKA